MILFWSLVAALTALGLAFVLPTLLGRRARTPGPDSAALNLAIYRERLAEASLARGEGAISDAEHSEIVDEISARVLTDVDAAGEPARAASSRAPRWAAVAVAIVVPVAALGLYARYGEPGAVTAVSAGAPGSGPKATREHVARMVDELARRLATSPNDGNGWSLLARSYAMLGRNADAVAAWSRAHDLLGDDPDLLASWAESEAAVNGNAFTASARRHLARALALAPDDPKALWLGGFAAAQAGDSATALARWERLRAQLAPGSQDARAVDEVIARLGGAAAPAATAPPSSTAGTGAAGSAVAAGTAGGAEVTVKVRLADALRGRASADQTVFVFARDPAGPPMPLAVRRLTVADLPATVVLDDSASMRPDRKLSSASRVVVVARVSRSGAPLPHSGDLEGDVAAFSPAGHHQVEVVIDHAIP